MRSFRPRRPLAAPVLASAFAAVPLTFGSEILFGRTVHFLAATAGALALVAAGTLVAAVVAARTEIGRTVERWPYGSLLVRPSDTAIGLVALSCCVAAVWLTVRPVVPLAFSGFLTLVQLVLYVPLWLLWGAVVGVFVATAESSTLQIPTAVTASVVAAGTALSALWQLLLAARLERRVARVRRALLGEEQTPDPARK